MEGGARTLPQRKTPSRYFNAACDIHHARFCTIDRTVRAKVLAGGHRVYWRGVSSVEPSRLMMIIIIITRTEKKKEEEKEEEEGGEKILM